MAAEGGAKLIRASTIIEGLLESKVKTVAALPDIVSCETLLWPISEDDRFRLVMVCKEDEGISICAGLSYCRHRAVMLMQHTGFLDSVNTIRAIAVEYQLPIVMLVGLQGMEHDCLMQQSKSLGIRSLIPICDALELSYKEIYLDRDATSLANIVENSYQNSQPFVLFLASSPI